MRSRLRDCLPILALLGCAPPDAVVYPLAEFAAFQRQNVTSDLISAPQGIGLDLARFGWQLRVGEGDAYLEQRHDVGRLEFFAAHGEVREVALEAGPIGDPGDRPLRVSSELNGRELAAIEMGSGWGAYRVHLPAEAVRVGWNFLTLRGRPSPEQDLSGGIVLRRTRFRSVPGRFRADRARAIEVWPEADSTRGGSTVSMPVASYFDAVLELPTGAWFGADLRLRPAAEVAEGPFVARLAVLASGGEENPLAEVRLQSGQPARLRADLGRWAGQLVRLRLSVGGPDAAVVEWSGTAVHGSRPAAAPDPLAPQPALAAPASGRLGRPDVVVVLLDTARADAFSCYGAEHPTPAADRLAGEGTRFARAIAPAPWTGQSVPPLLTGIYPDALGVGAFGSALPPGTATLAEMLAAAGYRTYLWSQHPFYRSPGDLLRGFEAAEFSPEGDHRALPAPDRLVARDRPTFALIHLMPPHLPYDPPPPFRGALTSWYEGEVEVTAGFLNSFPHRRDPAELTGDDRRYIHERYLEHAAFADSMLGELLAALDDRGRYDDALVVLLSDHGEAFLEHGFFLHGRRLYREYLEVPLIVKWPRSVAGHRPVVEAPVSLVDLVPTLVDGLGLDSPAPGFQGRTLLPAALDGAAPPARPIYALTRGSGDASRTPSTRLMLQTARWKAIFDPLAEAVELYDLEADPGEQRDLAAEYPLRALLWRQRILRQSAVDELLLVRTGASPREQQLDPDTIRQLKALGYL